MEDQDLGELFLIRFMRSLTSAIPTERVREVNENQSMQVSVNPKLVLTPKIRLREIPGMQIIPPSSKPSIKTQPPIMRRQFTNPQTQGINFQVNRMQGQNFQFPLKSGGETLNQLIKDPFVSEIECQDAESPLLVKKSGLIQKTQFKLPIEQIYEIVAEFSQKTRIPVIDGKIKAASKDLIITAVFSETLGPRFIIQKKKPFVN